MSELLVAMHSATDAGKRPCNEDAVNISPSDGIAVLADGMGGHHAGEIASRIAVDTIMQYLTQNTEAWMEQHPSDQMSTRIRTAMSLAHHHILDHAQQHLEYTQMASTALTAVFRYNHVMVGHLGDSRMYQFRGNTLKCMTRDHALVQESLPMHDDMMFHPLKHVLTHALGMQTPHIKPDITITMIRPDDLYLACSDGLHHHVPDEEIRATLIAYHGENLTLIVSQLMKMAQQRESPDNISIILTRILPMLF